MNSMKILFLADSSSTHTLGWVRPMVERGMEVALFSLHGTLEPGLEDLVDSNSITVVSGDGLVGDSFSFSFLRSLWSLRSFISAFKPDVVHAHYASSYGLLGALSGHRPFFLSVWGSDVYDFPKKSLFHRMLLKFNLSKADRIFSSSEVMAQETRRYTTKEVTVVPFGVESDQLTPVPREGRAQITIGTVKSLEHIYGVDTLISAFAHLRDSRPDMDLYLSIIGKGSELDSLEALARDKGVRNRVTFHGRIPHDELKQHLDKMDLFVSLSRQESFGVSTLEAMSCGLPVIVSDAPGPMEIVDDGENGIIVPKEDYLSAASAIEQLILDQKLRSCMGVKAREKVLEHYDRKKNVDLMMSYLTGAAL